MDKREKIQRSYDHYRRQITSWEGAMLKTTGRKPDKSDLSKAPQSIKTAYKEYIKIKKYLESHSENEVQPEILKNKQLTPKKIFFTYQARTMTAAVKAPLPDVTNEIYKKLSSKLFMAATLSKEDTLRFSLSAKTGPCSRKTNKASELENKTEELEQSVNEKSADICTAAATRNDSGDDCVDGCIENRDRVKNIEPGMKNKANNRISALWQNPALEASNFNSACNSSFDQIRKVDQSWLERCERDFDMETETDGCVGESGDFILDINDIRSVMAEDEIIAACPTKNEEIAFQPTEDSNSSYIELPSDVMVCDSSDSVSVVPCVPVENICDTNCDEVAPYPATRKRTSTIAFSPSPEKPQSKRKFFKTSKAERAKYRMLSQPQKPVLATATVVTKAEVSNGISGKTFVAVQEKAPKLPLVADVMETAPSLVKTATLAVADSDTGPKRQIKKGKRVIPTKNATTSNKAENNQNQNLPKSSNKQNTTTAGRSTNKSDMYDEAIASSAPKKFQRSRLSKKQQFQRKINDGKVNQNFVRIDVSRKVFVRGHKKISGAQVKRLDWKNKQSAASKLSTLTCRKCGETGHFAKFCIKGTALNSNEKQEPEQVDDSPFPTLEEAANMAFSKKAATASTTKVYENPTQSTCEVSKSEDSVPSKTSVSQTFEFAENTPSESQGNIVPPYFDSECSSDEQDELLEETLSIFGYDKFRDGQKHAITRVLNGLSSLVILSTGAGKSLCYQLPAYLYSKRDPGVLTLCISPLVSLMEDQVQGVPSFLNAACLHNNMTASKKEAVIERLRSKKLNVLLVSPEAICGGLFGLLRTGNLPPISFACIDEVHCVSQWSHNFRPSYLQICKILREKLNVTNILGLTATATDQTATSICEHIQIDPSTVIRGELIPRNLNLSVSRDREREEALLILLKGERFKECDSIIIYCTRREECEIIAKLLRINFQEGASVAKAKARQRISNNCEAYHAGMTPTRRRMVQKLFMNGEIRIVVATVAFGMGIDKSDIRAVIHYNMPKTFESYVQEIGRAGRDGLPAHCHLFLDNVKGKDLCELKRHVFSNSVDRATLRKLVSRIFKPCKCSRISEIAGENKENSQEKKCPGHEVSFSVNDTITELDLPQENIMTLLCYLELDTKRKWIELLPLTYELCKIQSYGGTQLLKSSAQKCPPLAVAIALKREKNRFKDKDTYLEFNVIETAATVGWNSALVKRELKNLEWTGTEFDEQGNAKKHRKSGIMVEFSELAFRVVAPGDITDEESDIILNSLQNINVEQEKTQLYQLNTVYQALFSVSSSNVGDCCDDFVSERSDRLKIFIHDYFQQSKLELPAEISETAQPCDKEEDIRRDCRNLMYSSQDTKFTGRAIAKIFQGISSPCFPAEQWGRNRAFWRKYLSVDFHTLCQIAGSEVIKY